MGLDFIRRAAPTFIKSWNHGLRELAVPNLFTRTPGSRARSVVAESEGANLVSGSDVTVASEGQSLVVLQGTHPVGRCKSAPDEVVQTIAQVGGIAHGKIGTVYPISGMFDVDLR